MSSFVSNFSRGKGKGKFGKGGGKSDMTVPLAPGRTLVADQRVSGYIQEWTQDGYGWAVPLQVISHPSAKKHNGRIFVDQKDVRSKEPLDVGTNIDFLLYCDVRGLGGGDVRPTEEDEEAGVYCGGHDGSEQGVGGDLPGAWETHADPATGEPYYWNSVTKESSWERPGGVAEEGAPKQGKSTDRQAAAKEAAALSAPVLGHSRMKGRISKWQGFFGWITPLEDAGVHLLDLMEGNRDKIYLNWREVSGNVEVKVGDLVEFLLCADDNGLAASDVHLTVDDEVVSVPTKGKGKGKKGKAKGKGKGEKEDPVSKLEKQWQRQDKMLGVEAPGKRRLEEEATAVAEDDGSPLLPGWAEEWSTEHNCRYYWHAATQQSAWDRPSMPADDDDDVQPAQAAVARPAEGTEQGAAHLTTPLTPMVAKPGRSMTPLTPGAAAPAPSKGAPSTAAARATQRNIQRPTQGQGGPIQPWQQAKRVRVGV